MTSNVLDAIWQEQLHQMIRDWDETEQAWRRSLETPDGAVYARDGEVERVIIGTATEMIESDVTVHTENHR